MVITRISGRNFTVGGSTPIVRSFGLRADLCKAMFRFVWSVLRVHAVRIRYLRRMVTSVGSRGHMFQMAVRGLLAMYPTVLFVMVRHL